MVVRPHLTHRRVNVSGGIYVWLRQSTSKLCLKGWRLDVDDDDEVGGGFDSAKEVSLLMSRNILAPR
eukprot:Awhi_evm1s9999